MSLTVSSTVKFKIQYVTHRGFYFKCNLVDVKRNQSLCGVPAECLKYVLEHM